MARDRGLDTAALSDRFGKALQGVNAIESLDGSGRFLPCCGEIVFELLIDPVDKLTATDDAAVYEIPGPIPEAVKLTEFEVSVLLLFYITNTALFIEEVAVIG